MSEEKIYAPFTDEQVEALNTYQQETWGHSFTCCGFDGCRRSKRLDEGELIATNEGWVCPCGKYKQNWAHGFMVKQGKLFKK